ncbi:hypothetical protein Tco_0675425 [Tanacetum coccineum]
MNEEQRAQIARDEEIARQWDEEERQRAMDEAKSTKKIDWNDPSVIRYHTLKMKPKTVAQARRNMIKYLKNQGNYKIKAWKWKAKVLQNSPEKMKSAEKMEEDDVAKETGAKRKKSIPRKSTRKRQKMEEDAEKEELKGFLDIIPREEVPIEVESISTKFPIVDWKTCVLTETFMYYQVFRGDGNKSRKVIVLIKNQKYSHFVDGEWVSNSYVDREEISFKPREYFPMMLKKKLEVDHEELTGD